MICSCAKSITVFSKYCKCSKVSNTFLFLFSNEMLVTRAELDKMLVIKTGKILIRLLLKKQSDRSLHCLCKSFGQATSV